MLTRQPLHNRPAYLAGFDKGLFSPTVEERAARYLRDHTEPGDGILVRGLSPGIYALADRHPVTRFPFHKLLLIEAPLSRMIPGLEKRRAEFLRRLHDDPPAYILIGTRDRNPFEPDDSMTGLKKFARFGEWVEEHYQPETRIGHFVVARRNP